jgi:integrase
LAHESIKEAQRVSRKRGNGEGSITRRKDGRWWGRYYVHTPEGRKQKAVYGKTRAEAAAKLRKAMSDLDGGMFFDSGTIAVGEFLDRWLGDCVRPLVDQGKMEHSTYVRYAGIVRNHLTPVLGRRKLKELGRAEVRRLYSQKAKELSPRSVDYIHVTLQKALNQAVRDDLVPRNVAYGERTQSSRDKEESKALSQEQVKTLLRTSKGERNEALYVVAVHTGLRQGELLGLRWPDVDLRANRLSVARSLKVTADGLAFGPPKNKASRRSVPLNKMAVAVLESHRKRQNEERLRAPVWHDHDLVFPNRVGKPMDHNNLYHREYKPLLRKAGLHDQGFTFHSLRHTFGTALFKGGEHPKVVQSLLGHASIVQTMDTYSHLLEGIGGDAVGGLEQAFG